MSIDDLLGRTRPLLVRRLEGPGAFLVENEQAKETYLLPGAEVPAGTKPGDSLVVFIYLDSEDRPIATLRRPLVEREDVAFLEVKALTGIGAFVDWGLPKELLVPFREQTHDLEIGDRIAVGLFVDDTGRLCGTMRVRELLQDGGDFKAGEWVQGEAWRQDLDVGLFVIVERGFVGLVPRTEPHSLVRGQSARFRIAHVYPDKRIELSLRGLAHEELENDAERILAVLRGPSPPRLSDQSSPEDIRIRFGLSKKAFKRAVGRLLKDRAVRIDATGALVATKSVPLRS